MDISEILKKLNGRKNLSEDEVKDILVKYQIPTTKYRIITSDSDFHASKFDILTESCSIINEVSFVLHNKY